jgi:hypothetical protein
MTYRTGTSLCTYHAAAFTVFLFFICPPGPGRDVGLAGNPHRHPLSQRRREMYIHILYRRRLMNLATIRETIGVYCTSVPMAALVREPYFPSSRDSFISKSPKRHADVQKRTITYNHVSKRTKCIGRKCRQLVVISSANDCPLFGIFSAFSGIKTCWL